MAFRDRLREVIKLRESPHRIAIAFSTGIFIGMSPFLGIHTLLGVGAAWLFRLNTFAIIAGVYITNPLTIVPIYTFSIWVGTLFLGVKEIIPRIDWSHITLLEFLSKMQPLLKPFIFGTLLVGFVSAIISYAIIYRAAKKVHHIL